MQIERTSARIAPRSAWQAMDLGTRLYQHWWQPLTRIWLVSTLLPGLLILALGYHWDSLAWAAVLFWWLKPLWEAPLLEFIARALFDPATRARDVLWRLPSLVAPVVPFLLWRRLDPSRAFHLPVAQLERQRGNGYSKRTRTLALGDSNHAGSCTVLMLHVEQALAYAVLILGFVLMPTQMGVEEVQWFGPDQQTIGAGFLLAWYLAMLVTEPLYICMSFALYLNKRTWLEGWDLELGLRRIGEKRRLGQGRNSWMAALVALSLGLGTLSTAPAQAQPSAEALSDQQQAIELLADERFMPMREEQRWRLKRDDSDDASLDDGDWLLDLLKWLMSVEPGDSASASSLPDLASVIRLFLWVVAISLVVWLIYRYRHWLTQLKPTFDDERPTPRPMQLAGLDIARHSLPDDIGAAARDALARNQPREALSLLYRATLSRLVDDIEVSLQPGATEQECLQAFTRVSPAHAGVRLLSRLTPDWISTAWAHRPPDVGRINELLLAWQHVFSAPAEVNHA